ncbi:ABC transporter permease [Streptomyces sp. CBMA29]|uniref:ABC transporter permease n=1 Tax=Streptomyces sp. CBMA29 TaxID=1896314 RepID=UPI001661BEA4|nr:FtsX-like permease family protein [Streptomyces sp. CBMA29]MBD0736929.1 ABC transporter permease [Streptomyces sp. CBMA29]
MNGLARASVRFRPASFVGTFVALLFASAVITACGSMLQTGITAHVKPVRYAATPVVVAADPSARITTGHGDDADSDAASLPDQPRVDTALADRIARAPGVSAAVPDTAFPVQSKTLPPLTGRDWSAHAIDASTVVRGSAPGRGEVALSAATARAAHVGVGDTLTLTAPTGAATYKVSGLTDTKDGTKASARASVTAGAGASAYFADPVADRLSGHPGRTDAIAVLPKSGVDTDELARQVTAALKGASGGKDAPGGKGAPGDTAKVRTGDGRGLAEHPELAEGKEMLTAIGASFGGIATATAVFVVMGTVALAIGQRGREIALLRAVGATPRQIRRTVATEAMLVAPIAGAAGILPGVALARWWVRQLVHRDAVPAGVTLSTGWIPMVSAVGAGLLAALAAGYLAARRPSKARPSQALGEAAVERRRPGVIRTVLGAAAVAGGCVLAAVAAHTTGEDAANVALGIVFCFMVGVAFLGPVVAWAAAALLGLPLRAGGAASQLAAANSRANARRLASAITPIVLVTAFCGTLLCMQGSLRHEAARQIKDGVVADQVLGSSGAGVAADTARRAAKVPGVDGTVGVLRTGALYRASGSLNSASLLGVSGDPGKLPDVLQLGLKTGSLSALTGDGRTVAVDSLLAGTAKVKVGDRIPLWLGDGTQVRPTVVATYERGLGIGQLLMPRAAVADHARTAYDTQVLVHDAPGADRTAVERDLSRLGVAGLTVTDRAGYRQQADKELELNAWANSVMAAVLGGFAAVAAANTLVMTVLDRRREVALLRLAGTTRRQVLGMVRLEALLVAAAGLLIGGAIAWITLVPIARGLTGASPYIPPGTALGLAGAATVLGLLSTALPARALLRANPAAAGAARE